MAFPFSQLLFNSLIIGSIYALVAAGFSLIYTTSRFMHFAHGATVITAGYILYALVSVAKLPFGISLLFTVLLTTLLGYLMAKLIYQPLQKRNASNIILLIASVAVLIFIENLLQFIFGANVKTIGLIKVARGLQIAGASITPLQITIILITILILAMMYLLMNKTKIGTLLRAVADNNQLASCMGIPARKIVTTSFIIGSFVASIAGILVALEQNLSPSMGTNLIVKGFTGAVIGGLHSVPAAIIGSYVIGLAENFGIWYLPSAYKEAIAFILLFAFLLFKPSGMFGKGRGAKE